MTNKTKSKIIELLASHLGLGVEDINIDDSFADDLRMSTVDLADFAHTLESSGYSVTPEDINNYDTVGELVDHIIGDELS